MPNDEIKLKPCFFCGRIPVVEQDRSTKKYWIHCENTKCKIQPFTDMHTSLTVIKREWNRREKDAE
jgi:hypothetical protein